MLKVFNDERSKSTIPWALPAEWQAVNRAIRFHLDRYSENCKPAVSLAQKVKRRLKTIFPVLDEICAGSCPWCPEPCCLKAGAFFETGLTGRTHFILYALSNISIFQEWI